ncbi:hypothetical protein KKA14_13305 [bacterium]|nr:hypothetical protein [bacterium]
MKKTLMVFLVAVTLGIGTMSIVSCSSNNGDKNYSSKSSKSKKCVTTKPGDEGRLMYIKCGLFF